MRHMAGITFDRLCISNCARRANARRHDCAVAGEMRHNGQYGALMSVAAIAGRVCF